MVMKLHTGVPGAGKSYLLIKSFVEAFCDWGSDENRYCLKKSFGQIKLISNIEGLTLDHCNLDVMISDRCQALARRKVLEESGNKCDDSTNFLADAADVVHTYYLDYMAERCRWFFEDGYQQSLAIDAGGLVYLIEESQRYFDSGALGRKPWVRDVLYFFERHRHHGISIFMDTQHASKLHKGIVALFEEEIRAKPRTLSVMGEFRYNSYCDGMKINQLPIVVKPDKRIFATYQSMTAVEVVKPKRPLFKLLVGVLVLFLFAFIVYWLVLQRFGAGTASAADVPPGTVSAAKPGGEFAKNNIGLLDTRAAGDWVRISHLMRSNGDVWVIHPVYNTIIPLSDMDLDVKVVGASLFAYLEV